MKLETRTLMLYIAPEGEPTFSDQGVRISIDDEAAGEYVVIERQGEEMKPGQIWIDPREWPTLRDAIDKMVNECRKEP